MKNVEKWNKNACWVIASVLADAEDGDVDAQCAVGERFWFGDLVREDRERAVYWYTQAAMQGHSYAQCCLAYAYALGEGVEKKPELAAYWYGRAADAGEEIGICSLAACYANGFGVECDPMRAYTLACQVIRHHRIAPRTPEGFDRP